MLHQIFMKDTPESRNSDGEVSLPPDEKLKTILDGIRLCGIPQDETPLPRFDTQPSELAALYLLDNVVAKPGELKHGEEVEQPTTPYKIDPITAKRLKIAERPESGMRIRNKHMPMDS